MNKGSFGKKKKDVAAKEDSVESLSRRLLGRLLDEHCGHCGEGEKKAIEAHGVMGMKSRPWRKTFKSREALQSWKEKHDAEVQGSRDVKEAEDNVEPEARDGEYGGVVDPDDTPVKRQRKLAGMVDKESLSRQLLGKILEDFAGMV